MHRNGATLSEPETASEYFTWTFAQWFKVVFSDESTFCFLFGNQSILPSGGRVERIKRCFKSSEVGQCWVLCYLLMLVVVGPLCFIESAIYQSTSCFHLQNALCGCRFSFLHQKFASAHNPKTATKWCFDHVVSVLYWPASWKRLYGVLSRGRWERSNPKIQISCYHRGSKSS